jgi:quinoprotein dehydrogenase-associated probable ABC transporter substrate-binding protein
MRAHVAIWFVLVVAGAALAARPVATSTPSTRPLPELRVCADPNNMPFSNEKAEGFENKIAELVARDLGTTLRFVWRPQRRGYVRNTLNSGACDLIVGVPSDFDPVRTTRPYYRSTYVFVQRADRGHQVTSLDDSLLRRLKIGIHLIGTDYANPPAAHALAARGIIDNVAGYMIYGDYSEANPPARLIEAVAKGDVDVAVVWGPLAGYFAKHQPVPLTIAPVPPTSDLSGQQWTFAIAMGVRRQDQGLAAALDDILDSERVNIRKILDEYGIPIVSNDAVSRVPTDKHS